MMRNKKLWMWIAVVMLFVFFSLNLLVYLLNKHFKSYLLYSINQSLQTELIIDGNVHFSFLEQFPHVSMSFSDVKLRSSNVESMIPLINARKISLLFNLLDIIQGDYVVKKILLEQGLVNIEEYMDGTNNYDVLKPYEGEADNQFKIDLRYAVLKNIQFFYTNEYSNQYYSIYFDQATADGTLSAQKLTLSIIANSNVEYLKIKDVNYFDHKSIDIATSIFIDLEKKKYSIIDGILGINNQKFEVNGHVWYEEAVPNLNLTLKARDANLSGFIQLLPQKYTEYLEDFYSDGTFDFDILIKGAISASESPYYEINFGLNDGIIAHNKLTESFKSVSFTGVMHNGREGEHDNKHSLIEILDFKAQLSNRPFSMNFKLLNFDEPFVNLKLDAEFDLQDIYPLFHSTAISELKGTIDINEYSFVGRVVTDSLLAKEFLLLQHVGKFDLSDIQLTYSGKQIKGINGTLVLNNHELTAQSLKLKLADSDFRFDVKLKDVLSAFIIFYLNPDVTYARTPKIKGIFQSGSIKVDKLIEFFAEEREEETTSNTYMADINRYFENITIELFGKVGEVLYENFSSTEVSANLFYTNRNIDFQSLSFTSMNGMFRSKGEINFDTLGIISLSAAVNIENLDIKETFKVFDNFGQKEITYNNLDGKVNSKLKFYGVWNKEGVFAEDSMYMLADIIIKDGNLKDYEPLRKLSLFVKVKDLKDIQFSELSNQIEIKGRKINIPTMLVVSNAAIMSLSGVHTFDNEMDYKMKINLSKVIANRFKAANVSVKDFEEETDGKLNLYIKMTGNASDPKFAYDKKEVIKKIQLDLQEEKKELKQILKDEFKKEYKPDNIEDWEDEEEIEFIDPK